MSTPTTRPMVLTIDEAAGCLGIGRTLMYALVLAGEVESVMIGRLRRVPAAALDNYLARLRACPREDALVRRAK